VEIFQVVAGGVAGGSPVDGVRADRTVTRVEVVDVGFIAVGFDALKDSDPLWAKATCGVVCGSRHGGLSRDGG
jgi:hypothetical protein